MKKTTTKKVRIAIGSALLVTVSFALVGFSNSDKHNFEVIKNLDLFFSIFKEVNVYYVDQPNPKKMIETAVAEMLGSLDPYTEYIPEENMDDLRIMTKGEYGGVGSIIQMSSDTCYVRIREIYRGFPADEAGLLPGDMFLEVDGKNMKNAKTSDVSELLRGKPNTEVKLKIQRPGQPKPFEVKAMRRKIQINPISYAGMLADGQTGYIALSSFTENCSRELRNAFVDLKEKQGARQLVIDLRSNPGGLLDEAINILSLFLPQGSKVLQTKGRSTFMEKRYVTQHAPIDTVMPLVVLINRASASASEIVAGALQDFDRAVIVGQRSYGKGLVQSPRSLDQGGSVKITTAKYYIPSGRCIQALDYSNRDKDGAVGYIPDSLISEFKTRAGRTVYDGGGVSPDVYLEGEHYSNISAALVANDITFSYAIKYRAEHPTIASPDDFHLTDADYADFCKFVENYPRFTYKNRSSDNLEKLIAAAKFDKYYDDNQQLFDSLSNVLRPSLAKDLELSKKQIVQFIEEEILTSFFYAQGYAPRALRTDSVAMAAQQLATDAERYRGLLDGSVPSHAGDKRQVNKTKE